MGIITIYSFDVHHNSIPSLFSGYFCNISPVKFIIRSIDIDRSSSVIVAPDIKNVKQCSLIADELNIQLAIVHKDKRKKTICNSILNFVAPAMVPEIAILISSITVLNN
ncbi:hypothetical protein CAXC1_220068 [Candidatus Xenohaliotis californiensis]|uniref:Uncharacterized protein n=1 Tax=Candidatus Xenohaliotis californiensis TaxID=84677 RepID=A0ABM9N7T9_9RICK|nr:hypothetical protein CAXC1_220068 [Candidatus Xenohaliotis californiensis]